MSDRDSRNTLDRRAVLRGIGLAAGAVGAAAAVTATKAEASSGSASRAEDGGYRETEHVRRAYEAAGF